MSEVENQAHTFAAAFLMPRSDIYDELPSRADFLTFFDLKQRWNVSIAALLMRARDLHKMTPSTYTSAMKLMSARGWRRKEPVSLGAPEQPRLLEVAIGDKASRRAAKLALPEATLEIVLSATRN
jgi:Zn-dependent peptidase ImmA (M78 family)